MLRSLDSDSEMSELPIDFTPPTSDSGFGSDNFESEVIMKIERFDRDQSESAPTNFLLSTGESPPRHHIILLLHVTYVCVLLFIF